MSWEFDRDFIKVPRGIIELLRDDPRSLTTYVALLARAQWQTGTTMTKHGPIELRRGQALCGRNELAQLCGGTERATRGALKVLQTIKAIDIATSNHGTIVTILGYEDSGAWRPADVQHPTGGEPAVESGSGRQSVPQTSTTKILDPRREIQDRSEHARARDPSTPVQAARSTELNAERKRLHDLALDRLNQARLDVGGRVKQSLRPLHPFDNKLREAVSFLLADEIIGRFEADLEHVLQIRIAEALANPGKNLRWLSSSLFEWGAWRVALSMSLADIAPKDDGPRELAYAPVRPEDDPPDFTYGIGGRA